MLAWVPIEADNGSVETGPVSGLRRANESDWRSLQSLRNDGSPQNLGAYNWIFLQGGSTKVIPLLLLFATTFAPQQDTIPNRQPQMAARGQEVALTFGAGNTVYFALSRDKGATWTNPVVVSNHGKLALGMRRGPRIAFTESSIVISAVVGSEGRGRDENLLIWRSDDKGATWSAPKQLNGVSASAREGLHAMGAGLGNTLFVAWLDLRGKGTQVFGAASVDGGKTWSSNLRIYTSPSGSVCECCHPSVHIDERDRIFVMFRNSLHGNRDMYVVHSDNLGDTFSAASKLGSASWKLNACPMDGGSIAVRGETVVAAWRREGTVYHSTIGGTEIPLGPGKQPVVLSTRRGVVVAWTEGKTLYWLRENEKDARNLDAGIAYPSLVELPDGEILLAGEHGGTVVVDHLK